MGAVAKSKIWTSTPKTTGGFYNPSVAFSDSSLYTREPQDLFAVEPASKASRV